MSAATQKPAIVPLALAAIAFGGLIWTETRRRQPLVDLGLFANRNFAIAAGLLFLVMFDIMTLLLYYNLFAQSADGLGMSAVAAGLSLLPLSVALFAFARAAPLIAAKIGMRRMLTAASLLLILGCAIVWSSLRIDARLIVLALGLLVAGGGIALIYASAPRLGLATLPPLQAGKGSGMLNSVQFSRRHRRRDVWRNPVRADRIFRGAGAAGIVGARERRDLPSTASGLKPPDGARATA